LAIGPQNFKTISPLKDRNSMIPREITNHRNQHMIQLTLLPF